MYHASSLLVSKEDLLLSTPGIFPFLNYFKLFVNLKYLRRIFGITSSDASIVASCRRLVQFFKRKSSKRIHALVFSLELDWVSESHVRGYLNPTGCSRANRDLCVPLREPWGKSSSLLYLLSFPFGWRTIHHKSLIVPLLFSLPCYISRVSVSPIIHSAHVASGKWGYRLGEMRVGLVQRLEKKKEWGSAHRESDSKKLDRRGVHCVELAARRPIVFCSPTFLIRQGDPLHSTVPSDNERTSYLNPANSSLWTFSFYNLIW